MPAVTNDAALPSVASLLDFSSSVAVITGAGSGIGRACARRFASAGAAIVAADINLAAAQATVDQVTAAGAVARMADVQVRLVGDSKALRRESLGQLFYDDITRSHAFA